MRTSALVISLVMLSGGCYFGRTASRKQAGYFTNGAAVAVGALLMLGDSHSSPGCYGAQDMCWSGGDPLGNLAGTVTLTAGVLGFVINLVTPTEAEPTPKPKPAALAARSATR